MSRLVYEQNTKVWFVPTIADPAAPSAAVIAAGTNVTPFLTKDGLTTPANQNMVDSASLDERFDAQNVGSFGGAVALTLFRDDDTDTAYELFTWGLTGFLVVGYFGSASVAADIVDVYPVESHEPVMQQTAANEVQRFDVQLAVTGEPNKAVAVVA